MNSHESTIHRLIEIIDFDRPNDQLLNGCVLDGDKKLTPFLVAVDRGQHDFVRSYILHFRKKQGAALQDVVSSWYYDIQDIDRWPTDPTETSGIYPEFDPSLYERPSHSAIELAVMNADTYMV